MRARSHLGELKHWLAVHNNAVTAVLLLVFGVDLAAKGLPPLIWPRPRRWEPRLPRVQRSG